MEAVTLQWFIRRPFRLRKSENKPELATANCRTNKDKLEQSAPPQFRKVAAVECRAVCLPPSLRAGRAPLLCWGSEPQCRQGTAQRAGARRTAGRRYQSSTVSGPAEWRRRQRRPVGGVRRVINSLRYAESPGGRRLTAPSWWWRGRRAPVRQPAPGAATGSVSVVAATPRSCASVSARAVRCAGSLALRQAACPRAGGHLLQPAAGQAQSCGRPALPLSQPGVNRPPETAKQTGRPHSPIVCSAELRRTLADPVHVCNRTCRDVCPSIFPET